MTDEEKQALDKLKRSANYFVMPIYETKIILELIEKQQKEIEELKQEKEYLNCIIESDKDNYINKDKIKAKIEECEKEKNSSNRIHCNYWNRFQGILQTLLEKE